MDRKRDFEELEFENPVEIREIQEEPKNRKGICLTLLVLFVCISAYLGYRLYIHKKETSQFKKKIEKLEIFLKNRENKLMEISKQLQKIQATFSNTNKNKKELINNISLLEKKLKKQKEKIKALNTKTVNLQREIKRLNSENKKLKSSNNNLKKTIIDRDNIIEKLKVKTKELENNLKQQSITLKNLRETFSMESNASKKLISELIDEQKKNRELLKENLKLKSKINELNKKIKRLENVEEGDLVPSSELLTLAKPLVNPPTKIKTRGLFSKVKGIAVVNAYIDEYGNVKNAYFVSSNIPAEKIDRGTLINKVLTTIKKWKFSPPLYKGKIAVKTWQPVVIPVQSE